MFAEADELETGSALDTDVCVVGAGAAGITLARALAHTDLRVIVLESGGLTYESETHSLADGRNRGLPYFPLQGTQLRYFGGTTNHWGGYCRPFEDIDFLPREGIRLTGWPIRRSDLDPYYPKASEICGLPGGDWGPATAAAGPLPLRDDRFVSRIARIVAPEARSFARFRDELEPSRNVTVLLHANVTELEADADGGRVTSVRAATVKGTRLRVRAREFVLAAGGIENPRLLLASNRRWPRGLGNGEDRVGRYFMEHPRFLAAHLAPADHAPNPSFYDEHRAGDELRHGYLATARELQREEGLLDLQISLAHLYDVPEELAEFAGYVGELATEVNSWQRIAVPGSPLPIPYPEVIRQARSDPEDTYNFVRGRTGTIGVTTRIEQAPNPDSRVTLARARDPLGVPRPVLNWQLSRADRDNVHRALELLAAEVARSGLGRLRILVDEDDAGWPDDTAGGWHLMGTTRMSDDPRQGVVDRHARVHGVANLHIAGSSVFATAGGATPTLTLVALTLRLADRLRARMGV